MRLRNRQVPDRDVGPWARTRSAAGEGPRRRTPKSRSKVPSIKRRSTVGTNRNPRIRKGNGQPVPESAKSAHPQDDSGDLQAEALTCTVSVTRLSKSSTPKGDSPISDRTSDLPDRIKSAKDCEENNDKIVDDKHNDHKDDRNSDSPFSTRIAHHTSFPHTIERDKSTMPLLCFQNSDPGWPSLRRQSSVESGNSASTLQVGSFSPALAPNLSRLSVSQPKAIPKDSSIHTNHQHTILKLEVLMVNTEVSLKSLLADNVPMIFTLLIPINFTETGRRFVYLRDILEEVAGAAGLALQEDSCFDYWVVDDTATSSAHSTPCFASCRCDNLAAFSAATDSSDKVLGLTGCVLDIDSLQTEATLTLRVYEHVKARLPFVNDTARPRTWVDVTVPSGAPSASKHDLLVREKRQASPSDKISDNSRPNTEPESTNIKLVNSEDHAPLPTYSEGRQTLTDLMLEAYPQEIVLDPWRPNGTWDNVLTVRMDPGSSGGLSHMWAFSASSSRTDSKGRWKGPRLDAKVEYSK